MFVLKRAPKNIIDEIALGDGPDAEILKISVVPSAELLQRYRNVQLKIASLQKAGIKTDADIAAFGKAICECMATLLGDENAAKILAFYEGNYTEMLSAIMPYLQSELAPKIQSALKNYKKQFK